MIIHFTSNRQVSVIIGSKMRLKAQMSSDQFVQYIDFVNILLWKEDASLRFQSFTDRLHLNISVYKMLHRRCCREKRPIIWTPSSHHHLPRLLGQCVNSVVKRLTNWARHWVFIPGIFLCLHWLLVPWWSDECLIKLPETPPCCVATFCPKHLQSGWARFTYLSAHSLTTAKLPSPITFPTLYFSKMAEAGRYWFPLTAEDRQELKRPKGTVGNSIIAQNGLRNCIISYNVTQVQRTQRSLVGLCCYWEGKGGSTLWARPIGFLPVTG